MRGELVELELLLLGDIVETRAVKDIIIIVNCVHYIKFCIIVAVCCR